MCEAADGAAVSSVLWHVRARAEYWKQEMSQHQVRRISGPFQPVAVTSQNLWHVMPSWKLNTFLDGGLWMARMDQFGDPREGTLPWPNLGLLNKLPAAQVPAVLREYEFGVKRAYASCWHMSNGDPSDHAWNTFGHIGLRTTPNLMVDAFSYVSGPGGPVHFGQITYIDHRQAAIPEANVIEAGFVVRDAYQQENEARVLIHTHGTAASDHLYGKKGLYGDLVQAQEPSVSISGKREFVGGHYGGKAIVLKIDPQQFIAEIVIHGSTPDRTRQQMIDELKKAGLHNKLRL